MRRTGLSAMPGSASWRTYKELTRYVSSPVTSNLRLIMNNDVQNNAMMNSDGKITQLGEQYIGEITVGNDTDPTVSSSVKTSAPSASLLSVLAVIYLLV